MALISFIFFVFILSSNSLCQQYKEFACPLRNGKIFINKNVAKEWGKIVNQAEIKSYYREVFSCSEGTIIAIDTSLNGGINIGVEVNDLIFIYDHLQNVSVLVNTKVKKGQLIGRLKRGERLLLRIIKDLEYIDPKKVLPCKSVKTGV